MAHVRKVILKVFLRASNINSVPNKWVLIEEVLSVATYAGVECE